MKYIDKSASPRELRSWFRSQPLVNGRRINCSYDEMPAEVRSAVKQRLLEDQGWICCYTGIRIDHDYSHIEHFKPQYKCVGYEDIDFANLLAAYPGVNLPRCPYGAHKKDNWYDPPNMVNPIRPSCESQFRFDPDGGIHPLNNSQAASDTIYHLRLDHYSLTEMRRQAIKRVLRSGNLSRAQIEKIAKSYCVPDRSNRLPIFCFVIQQVAQDLLHKADRDRVRREEIHRQNRK